jgi:4-hydroxy-2-oxoheptanedioate aldolase
MLSTLAGRPQYGLFLGIPCAELAEMAALAGFDFIVLDGEHGRIPPADIYPLLMAAKAAKAGIAVYYRLAGTSARDAALAMDEAVDGIIVPQVSFANQLRPIIAACRFAPEGERGVHPAVRAARYGLRPHGDYLTGANRESVIVAQVEGEAALQNLPEILNCPGLNGIFVGPYDLSQSLGIPGQVEHPLVTKALADIAQAAQQSGIPFGSFAGTAAAVKQATKLGYSFLGVSIDTLLISRAMHSLVSSLHQVTNQ